MLTAISSTIDKSLIAGLELFRDANHAMIAELLQGCEISQIQAGEVLLSPGVTNRYLYLIIEGRIRIHLNSIDSNSLTVLGPGECLGEMSVIESETPSAFAITDTSCEVLAIHRDSVWTLINNSHEFARNLLYTLSGRLRSGNNRILEGLQQQKAFEKYAHVDALTGLFNRRWLDDVMEKVLPSNVLNRRPVSIIMIDIDHFKSYNDNYGHQAGDHALKSVAQLMKRHLHPSCLAARYGGEEFTIMLPDANSSQVRAVAEKLRQAVSEETLAHPETGEALPQVTISLGIAYSQGEHTPAMLLSSADAALYRAKKSGRNCVSE